MRALELYSGIGGFAAAVEGCGIEVVSALDASSHVVQTYNINWPAVARQRNILQMTEADFTRFEADLWWMSPPCAPYTRRGHQLDLADHRTASYLRVVEAITSLKPTVVAMENVEGFAQSAARDRLVEALDGYQIAEWVLCPTEIGVPNKRPRYYLVARRDGRSPHTEVARTEPRSWVEFVEGEVDVERYRVPPDVVAKYGSGFHVVDVEAEYATCFTGSYGKSWNFTGSYLRLADGGLRRFTPREVLNFLGFGAGFEFPAEFNDRQRYKYAGNSLCIAAVQAVLGSVIG